MNNTTMNNCFIFSWQQIVELTTSYTTYTKPNTNETFNAQIGALTVLGTIDDYDLEIIVHLWVIMVLDQDVLLNLILI